MEWYAFGDCERGVYVDQYGVRERHTGMFAKMSFPEKSAEELQNQLFLMESLQLSIGFDARVH